MESPEAPVGAIVETAMNGVYHKGNVTVYHGDALDLYERWPRPTVIISDGPYGLGSFPGDPVTVDGLPAWYRPHLRAWYRHALPCATLWFWGTELGWATVHGETQNAGWEFRNCHIWDKGIAHIAGNSNSATLRKFPVTTEVCVQYVRRNTVRVGDREFPLREWLRHEWLRAGLPLCKTNLACGVRNAATRKYFTEDHLWYFPPPEAFEGLVRYANENGKPEGRPYFSPDGRVPLTGAEWSLLRAKFHCCNGTTNVWRRPAVRGAERIKQRSACVHMNQKPVELLELCIRSSSDAGDVVWEPFGGLCSAAVAAKNTGRQCFSAEILREFYDKAVERFAYDLF
jgi:site-specific DNA-methyltransferase (adenine-specific)